jgi:hypothetical protein
MWSLSLGATHFRTKTLAKVRTEMSLHVLAYNLKRVIVILGAGPLMVRVAARASETWPVQSSRRVQNVG